MPAFKDELLEWARSLPDDCTLDHVEEFVRLRREVKAGLGDVEANRVIADCEVKQRVAEWLTSYGQGMP